ncbi:MAG: hypothetical protein QM648_10735 [Solirubrobacterales bacterium]
MAGSISIIFDGLARAEADDDPISPALPLMLQLLARRGIPATFFVEPELAAAEPFAITMIENGGHKIREGAAPTAEAAATLGSAPADWHPAMQVAVGRAVRTGERVLLSFAPAALERGDAIGIFGETLDLIAGLRRAGSLEVLAYAPDFGD